MIDIDFAWLVWDEGQHYGLYGPVTPDRSFREDLLRDARVPYSTEGFWRKPPRLRNEKRLFGYVKISQEKSVGLLIRYWSSSWEKKDFIVKSVESIPLQLQLLFTASQGY